MKKYDFEHYHIQTINSHLFNILEDNYYIELGCVDVEVISNILNGKMVNLSDLIYIKILVNGIGKITNDSTNDMAYQFNYLYSIHERSSSSKFILTCGVVRYYDDSHIEKFAPLILIPLDINYKTNTVCINGEATINTCIMKYLTKIQILSDRDVQTLKSINDYKIQSILDIDTVTHMFDDSISFSVGCENYLSVMEVEYFEFAIEKNHFNTQRSILETNDYTIMNNFFSSILSVFPTNIEQKYIMQKAHNGENFVVDGKFGVGKTRTIINIICDAVYNNKKVLYVNQDINTTNYVLNTLVELGLSKYIYEDCSNLTITKESKTNVFEEKQFDLSIIDKLNSYRNIYERKFCGYPYSYIIEKLSIQHALGHNECIPIEVNLERHEVEYIYKSLKNIEKSLESIDPFPSNPWSTLLSSKKAPTIKEIIDRTTNFNNIQDEVCNKLQDFSKKYHFKDIIDIHDFNHLNEEIISFLNIKPLKIWSEDSFQSKAFAALDEISALIDTHYNSNTYYEETLENIYSVGNASNYIKTLSSKYFVIENQDSPDNKYVDVLLSTGDELDSFYSNLVDFTNQSTNDFNDATDLLPFTQIDQSVFIFFNKVLDLYMNNAIYDNWHKEYLDNSVDLLKKARNYLTEIAELDNLYKDIEEYVLSNFYFSNLQQIISSKRFDSLLKKYINKKALKAKHISFNDIKQKVKKYYEQGLIVKHYVPSIKEGLDDDSIVWKEYSEYLRFLQSLTSKQHEIYTKFTKKLLQDNTCKNKLIKCLHNISSSTHILDDLLKTFNYYHIRINGEHFISYVDNIKSTLPYIKSVIETRNIINKVYKTSNNITVFDLLVLREVDNEYLRCLNTIECNRGYYSSLFGDAFKDFDTNVSIIGQTINHFDAFMKRLTSKTLVLNIVTSCESRTHIDEFFQYSALFVKLYNDWYNALRGFSTCFFGGKMNIQNKSFKEVQEILHEHITRLDQVELVANIEYDLDEFYDYSLKALPKGIQSGEYSFGIAEKYLYSTLYKYFNDMQRDGFVEFDLDGFVSLVDSFKESEQQYCNSNQTKLLKKLESTYLNKRKKTYLYDFKDQEYYHRIFIADVDRLNNLEYYNNFDLLIVDDGQLSSANKYTKINNFEHVIVFGNRAFQSSITNSLLHRVSEYSLVPLNKRYLNLSFSFENIWQSNNQFIYNPNLLINIDKERTIESFAYTIYQKYLRNQDRTICVIVSKKTSRRLLYTYFVQELSKNHSQDEVLNIIKHNLIITSVHETSGMVRGDTYKSTGLKINENVRNCDFVYLWYPDIENVDKLNKSLIIKNYLVASREVNICYAGLYSDKPAKKQYDEIIELISNTTSRDIIIKDMTSFVYQSLQSKGIKVDYGFGFLDLIAISNDIKLGIVIFGRRMDVRFSIVDDYLFYVDEYKKRGWNILLFRMEEFFTSYDECIEKIVETASKVD